MEEDADNPKKERKKNVFHIKQLYPQKCISVVVWKKRDILGVALDKLVSKLIMRGQEKGCDDRPTDC